MAPRTTFADLPSGLKPVPAMLDAMFADLGGSAVIPSTASGTNSIVLTERDYAIRPSAYRDGLTFGFTVGSTSTGAVTIAFRSLGAKNLYHPNGTTAVGAGALFVGTYTTVTYSSDLNGGVGGFYLSGGNLSPLIAIGGNIGLGTATPGNILAAVPTAKVFTIANTVERSILELHRASDALATDTIVGQVGFWAGATTPRQIAAVIAATQDTSEDAGKLLFYTMPSGGSLSVRGGFSSEGLFNIGSSLAAPTGYLSFTTPSNSQVPGLWGVQTGHNASVATGFAYNKLAITGDGLVLPNPEDIAWGFQVAMETGGTAARGGRGVIGATLTKTTATSGGGARDHIALNAQAIIGASGGEGGTDTGAGAVGRFYTRGAQMLASAPNLRFIVGDEIDVGFLGSGSGYGRIGLNIVDQGVARGSTVDHALSIGSIILNQGWMVGIEFWDGNGRQPIATTGTAIKLTGTYTIGTLIDGPNYTFTDNIFNFAPFKVTGAGVTTITGTSASQFAVGRQGAANPAFAVDSSTALAVTGVLVTSAAAGNGAGIFATSSVANESLVVGSRGSSPLLLNFSNTGSINLRAGALLVSTASVALGAAGTLIPLVFANATSGTITLQPVAGALGTVTLSLPARTDTLVTLAGTEALTNKTYNGNTFTAGTGVLTIAAGKTATHNATTTFAGTDGKTLTISNSGTLSGGDAFVLAIAAGKTLTASNTLTFTGTDSSSVAFGTGGTVLYTSNLGTGVATFLATPSSANLAAAVTDETGTAGVLTFESVGTWTPVLTFATPGNLSVSYTLQGGHWIKQGKKVTMTFNILTSAFTHTTASGDLNITGMPFTVANESNGTWRGTMQVGGVTKAGYTNFVSGGTVNTTTMIMVASGSGVAVSTVKAADMPTGGTVQIQGSLTYMATA